MYSLSHRLNLIATALTRKIIPVTGRASSFLVFYFEVGGIKNKTERRRTGTWNNNYRPIILAKVISFFTDYKTPPNPNLYHTQISILCLYTYMASFSSLALLSSSISTTNLRCLLATTFASLSFLSKFSNYFSSPRFNLLGVARRCFWWSSVFDDLFFSCCTFFLFSILLYHFCVLSSAILPSVLQSLKIFLL